MSGRGWEGGASYSSFVPALLDLTNPKWRIHHPTGTPSIRSPKNTPAIQARHDINVALHFGLTDVRTNLND